MTTQHPVVAWPGPDGLPPQVEASEPPAAVSLGTPILMVVGAVGLFSLADIFAKVLSPTLPSLQIVLVRYALFFAVSVLLLIQRRPVPLRSRRPMLQVVRAITLLGSATLFILGLSRLGVPEATAISFATPAMVTALSIPFLGEVVHFRRWTALILGLLGILIVARPGAGAFQPAALFPLASAFCGAIMVIVTRRIGDDDRTSTTLVWSSGIGLAILALAAPWWFVPMSDRELLLAGAMGLLYAGAQYLLVLAYRRGEASFLAPFSYAQVILATAIGYAIFATIPDPVSLSGMGLIVLSGAYTLHREGIFGRMRTRRRRARRAVTS